MTGFHHIDNDTLTGTIGGTLLAIIAQLSGSDIIRTLILASVGAIASFVATHACKWVMKKVKSRFFRNE